MEAGRAVSIKAEEETVEGKVLHNAFQIALFKAYIHDLLFPGNPLAAHVDPCDPVILCNIFFFQDFKIILP